MIFPSASLYVFYSSWAAIVCLLTISVSAQTPDPARQEDTHLFGLIPNFKTVPDRETPVPRMSVKDKFRLAARDSFDPSAFLVSGIYAGFGQLARQNESWGLGAKGYGKRYAAAVADQVLGAYLGDAVVPALFHQDPRYYRMARGPAGQRLRYAISRTFITRSDSGKDQLNAAEFLGNAARFAISTAYYPPETRTANEVGTKYIAQFGSDAFFNVLKEFWPEVRRKLSRRH